MGKPNLKSRVDGNFVIFTNIFTPLTLFQAQFVANTLHSLTQLSFTTAHWCRYCYYFHLYRRGKWDIRMVNDLPQSLSGKDRTSMLIVNGYVGAFCIKGAFWKALAWVFPLQFLRRVDIQGHSELESETILLGVGGGHECIKITEPQGQRSLN